MYAAAPGGRLEPHNRVAGKFRLGRRLAVGGMGEVWVARNEATGADVALKMLRRGDADRERELQIEERFRHEARLSAMLSHRSIVKIFDLIQEPDGTLVLVMELLRGETLQAYLEKTGPRPSREAVAIVSPILSALAHAHERGIVHRDVSPANIFLAVDPDGHVTPKLVDFGIAKLVGVPGTSPTRRPQPVLTMDGRVLGTPRYMAPERIRGSSEIDGRTDLFSVGVVTYETMTGVSPFSASSASASLAAVLERTVDADDRIEPRLWLEIQRAISKRQYERHASADELATALRAAIGESEGGLEGSLKRPPPPSGWEEESEPYTPALREHLKTNDGQTFGVVPRSRIAPAVWLGVGAMVGIALAATIVGLKATGHTDKRSPTAVQPGQTTAASPAPSASAESPSTPASAPSPPVSEAPSSGPSHVDTPPAPHERAATAAPATTTTGAAPAPNPPAKLAAPGLHATPRPKPIATTPGF
jgi:eukaryotic-like serine/threonine-protein kinase